MFAELLRDLASKVERAERVDAALDSILKLQGTIMSQLDDLNTKIDVLGTDLSDSKAQTDTLLAGMAKLRSELAAAHQAGTEPDLSSAIAKLDTLAAGMKDETAKEVAAMTPAAPVTAPADPTVISPVTSTPDPGVPTTVSPAGVSPVVLPVTPAIDPAVAATAATADAAAIPVGTVPVTDQQKAQASPSIDSGATVLHDTTDTNPLAPVATTVPGGDGTTPTAP